MRDLTKLKRKTNNITLDFFGDRHDQDILIGSHGNTKLRVKGNFSLSGVIYAPKYKVVFSIEGKGKVVFRGICHTIIIKKMSGDCLLDLSQVTCKEMQCVSLRKKATVISGKVRSLSTASLHDNATLHLNEKPLILNFSAADNSRITAESGEVVFP